MKGKMKLLRSLLHIASKQRLSLLFALALLSATALHAQSSSYTGPPKWINHATAEMGFGGVAAAGSTSNTVHPGFGFIMGIGYRWNERLSALLEWSLNADGMPRSILQQAGQSVGDYWFNSIAVDPLFNYIQHGKWAGYVIGGGGISFKDVIFTRYTYVASSESSSQPMFDVGTGVTFHFHEGYRGGVFLETRYVKMFTPTGQYPGFGTANTELVPVTMGLRF